MKKISERILFMGFENVTNVEAEEYYIINNNDYDILSTISDLCTVIILCNVNMSSHFMNVVRKKLNNRKIRFILGGNKLSSLLTDKVPFTVIKSKNSIIIDECEYVFQTFDSYENLKYDMDLNLNTFAYCMRPNKKFGQEYLQIMETGLQDFHERKCFIKNNQIWYNGGLLPTELYDWCDQNFDEYLSELKSSIAVFHDIIIHDENTNDISNSNSVELLSNYYKFTDYIGTLVDVVNYKIWDALSPERIFLLQSFSSDQFTIKDSAEKALIVLSVLSTILDCEESLKQYYENLCKFELSRIEYWFILLNILSDVRRKSMQILRNQNDYIKRISKVR